MANGFDLLAFRDLGVQSVENFFELAMREQFAELGRQIGKDVRAGRVNRSSQFAQGVGIEDDSVIADSGRLHEVAKEILGEQVCWASIRVLMKDKTFNGPIEVHQDWPYFGGDTRKLNVFVPLTRCRRENGMLVFYERSHLLGPVERGAIDIERFPEFDPVCPSLEVGDVLFADFLTWHSSVGASEDEDRIMLQVVLQPASDRSANNAFGQGWQPLGREVPYRSTPMLHALPSIGVQTTRHMLSSGKIDEAERMARGLNLDSCNNVEAHLLLHEIAAARGEDGSAHLEAAVAAVDALRKQVDALLPLPQSNAQEIRPAEAQLLAEVESLQSGFEAMRYSRKWKLSTLWRQIFGGRGA